MSRRTAIALAWALALMPLAATAQVPAVVPNPISLTREAGEFALARTTPIVADRGDSGARHAAANFADLLAKSAGLKLPVVDEAGGESAIRFHRVAELAGGP